jgi:hypothetical protein
MTYSLFTFNLNIMSTKESAASQHLPSVPPIAIAFKRDVTREQLIATLDSILGKYGCRTCGLNGYPGVTFIGDPGPEFSSLSESLVANVAHTGVANVEAR